MAKDRDPARNRLARLLRFARGRRRAVVVAQSAPDPDGMASAAALKHILQEKAGVEGIVATSGEIGRAENRAILQFLGETFEDVDDVDLDAFDLVAMVDTQPGFRNNAWPDDRPVHIVLDHHPRAAGNPIPPFADIRPDYGATASLLTEYLRAARIEPSAQLATALLYGIKTDTQDLSRGAQPADTDAFLYLYARANARLLGMIERRPLPREHFAALSRALQACRLYDTVAITNLGTVPSPDAVGEHADAFLRVEGVRWALCYGICDDAICLSLRTVLRQGKAGAVMAALLANLGDGGGHDMFAGGQVPLAGRSADDVDALTRQLELRLLRLVDVSARTPEPLVPGHTPEPPSPPDKENDG